jgi:hypothetical protein
MVLAPVTLDSLHLIALNVSAPTIVGTEANAMLANANAMPILQALIAEY